MAEAVLSITLETLRNLLLEEASFLSGVGDQVKEIQAQLEMMKGFLIDADRRQHNEERVRTWIQQVRRLAYRTEDVLETYALEIASKRSGKGIKEFACIFSKGKALHKVGEQIASIKSEIANLNTSCQTFGIRDLSEGESLKEAKEKQRMLRQTYAHEDEEHFVGMKDDILELVSLITDDERDHRVISVWGMGGLGKTTLARKIFKHEVVRRSFGAFVWVCVTQQCHIGTLLTDILRQLGHDVHGDQSTLVRELYKILNEKKCLVVLDDIWELDDWNILRHAFPSTEGSSKILLTTRVVEVANEGFLYKLRYLSEAESLELLRRKALNGLNGKEPIFEAVGKQIIKKCGHLPLAISAVGGILRRKNSLEEWEMVNKEIDLYLERETCNKETNKSVQKVLSLSYDELPYYLRPCFLYMGHFPEDAIIATPKLYHLWIAEGFLLSKHRKGEETMIDVADRYFNELVSRCMVEVERNKVDFNPTWKDCRLHDLMRDLCLEKSKEEEFYKILDISGPKLPEISLSDNQRKLRLNFSTEASASRLKVDLFENVKSQCIRSLYFCGYAGPSNGRLLLHVSKVKKFKSLKVLLLENCVFQLRREISQLIHLRYLSLYGSQVKELPSSISSLSHLETLDLSRVNGIYLPNIFSKMKQLKHIYLPFLYGVAEKLQFNDLHELETLCNFHNSKFIYSEISGLININFFSGNVEFDSSTLAKIIDEVKSWRRTRCIKIAIYFSNPETIEDASLLRKVLLCENLNTLSIRTPVGKFPEYEAQFCRNLLRMELLNTKMEEDPMQFLKNLSNLRQLSLTNNAFLGKEMVCDSMAFAQLTSLELGSLHNLEKWRVEKGSMPNLSCVYISSCQKFAEITDGLNFSALRSLSILNMREEFTKKYTTLHDQERKNFCN